MDAQTLISVAILGGLLLMCALLAIAFLVHRSVIATIVGFSWFRQIRFEYYIWVRESSYSGFPDGSRNQVRHIEHYQSYEQIRTETKTTVSNGQTTTSTSPVYGLVRRTRTKYSYEIQKWVESRRLESEGEERATLHWPDYKLDLGNWERVKEKRAKYLVFFQNAKGKQYQQKLAEADWSALDEQVPYTIKVNIFGHVKLCTPYEEQEAEIPGQTM